MANYVEELAAFLGWEVDSKELAEFNNLSKDVTDTIKGVAVAVTAAAAGVAAFVTMTNKATAVQTYMARANDVSAQSVEDWGRMLSAVGATTESVTKSFAFLNKTMGGIKSGAVSATMVEKALEGVNLKLSDFQKLNTEDQYKTLLQAAKDTEDSQLAAAAATALLGRDAGKTVGYLRTQVGTVEELLAVQAKMNLQTDEGREGAIRFFGAIDHLEAAFTSTRESLAGLIGAGVSPMLEATRDWIAANNELIKTKIKEWADRITIGLKWLWNGMQWTWRKTNQVVDALGGFENVLKLIGLAMAVTFSVKVVKMVGLLTTAIKGFGTAALAAQAKSSLLAILLLALALAAEDLYYYFTGGESALGKLGDKIAEFAHTEIRPFIASMLGMTPEELDLAMVRVVSAVTNFFTKSIPEAYNWLVAKVEEGIAFLIERIIPISQEVFQIFKDIWANMIGYLGSITSKIVDAITKPFKLGISAAKGLLSSLPGGETLGSILPGSGPAPAEAGVAATSAARAAASSITNNRASSSNVNQATTINVTQLPGESGEGLARRLKDQLGAELRRAVVATNPGVE
jgi:hypothetical protein